MAVNPLISSPQITLTQAANQNMGQMTNATDTKAATQAIQTQDSGFNANVGKQNTEMSNPKINQDTNTSKLQTPNTSQQTSDQLKSAEVPQINTDASDLKTSTKTGQGMDLNKTDAKMSPDQAKDGLSDTGILGSFNGYLKKKAADYMTNQVKGSTSQGSTDTSGPKENSTQGNYKSNDVNNAPQRPEAQSARPVVGTPSPAATPKIPSYNRPVSTPPPVPKIPKFNKPF
jgi:hypothetical protein